MLPMAIERRTFLLSLAALFGGSPWLRAAAAPSATLLAANARLPDGSYAAVLHDLDRGLLRRVLLPGRGHDITYDPINRMCIAFARRPGNFALAFAVDSRAPPIAFTAPPGRHFYGHGVVSRDGRLLFTTENDFASGNGIIGIWDAASGFRRIGELPAHGVGPHDINILRDGRTLVIANGGIVTHPDSGRTPLNLATMQPSLVYVDSATGDLLERQTLPSEMHKLSIRHLEVASRDVVVFGCQYKGAKTDVVDLIGLHRRGRAIDLLDGGPDVDRALRHYVSSVAVDRSGTLAAVSSSRGQHVVFVDIAQRAIAGTRALPDVSGVAAGSLPGSFMLTNGSGDVVETGRGGRGAARAIRHFPLNWDNHAISIVV